jgi:hypothetical protein
MLCCGLYSIATGFNQYPIFLVGTTSATGDLTIALLAVLMAFLVDRISRKIVPKNYPVKESVNLRNALPEKPQPGQGSL